MATKRFNSYTPSRRNMTVLDYQEITKKTPEKSLLTVKKETGKWKWVGISFLIPTLCGIILCFVTTGVYNIFT